MDRELPIDLDALIKDLPSDREAAVVHVWDKAYDRYAVVDKSSPFAALEQKKFSANIRSEIISVLHIYFLELGFFRKFPELEELYQSGDAKVESRTAQCVQTLRDRLLSLQRERDLEELRIRALASIRMAKNEESGYARLSAEEKGQIHQLIDSIRSLISESDASDFKKDRLLSSLNKLAREVDMNGTWADSFYVFMGRIGEGLGEFGTKSEPLWRQTRQMIDTVWRARRREEQGQLPAPDIDLLPPPLEM